MTGRGIEARLWPFAGRRVGRGRTRDALRRRQLGVQRLEPRLALTADPVLLERFSTLDGVAGQWVASGDKVFGRNTADVLVISDGTSDQNTPQIHGVGGTFVTQAVAPRSMTDSPVLGGEVPPRPKLFFSAAIDRLGRELFVSDGTAAGTRLVKEIRPGVASSMTAFDGEIARFGIGGVVLFRADDGVHGTELWRSDGTEAGTFMVRDIVQGSGSSTPTNFVQVGSTMFFSVRVGPQRQLWKTDGTTAGTAPVRAFPTQAAPFAWMHNAGGRLMFLADDGAHGWELWTSNGTTAGTSMVKDVLPGSAGQSSAVRPTSIGTTLYFAANDGVGGQELWKSDGTAAGTTRVRDIRPGAAGGLMGSSIRAVGKAVYFAATEGVSGVELWKSDGTAAGTVRVRDISGGSASSLPQQLTAVGTTLYFTADEMPASPTVRGSGRELWKTDGTAAGTVLVRDIRAGTADAQVESLVDRGGTLFFTAHDGVAGRELWTSDGTRTGTRLVVDLEKRTIPSNFANLGERIVFAADGGGGLEPWVSDGTVAGTRQLVDAVAGVGGSAPGSFTVAGQWVYFVSTAAGASAGLWRTDGTPLGTSLVKALAAPAEVKSLTAVGETLFFSASDDAHGRELWKSDGTAAGTGRLKDISPGAAGSNPLDLAAVGGSLFFSAVKANSRQLWKSDGSDAGTQLVKDIEPGPADTSPDVSEITNVNGVAFFKAYSPEGFGLWRSDGTEAGTWRVKDIDSGVSADRGALFGLHAHGGLLYFAALDDADGVELWRSNGTAAGTTKLASLVPGAEGGYPMALTSAGGRLFFVNTAQATSRLWTTADTAAGAVPLAEAPGGSIQALTAASGMLFFTMDSGATRSLWKTDGTVAGTTKVVNVDLGQSAAASSEGLLATASGSLYFANAVSGPGVGGLWRISPRTPAYDFNGDGILDLPLQADTGMVTAVIQNAAGQTKETRVLLEPSVWQMAVIADLDGNGVSDKVYRNTTTGVTLARLLDATGVEIGSGELGTDPDWRIEGSGDYDGDGREDLLWRSEGTGKVIGRLMNGTTVVAEKILGGDASQRPVTTAADYDSNGDGRTDLIWRNAVTGGCVLWRMNGLNQSSTAPLGGNASTAIVGTGDFDRDGKGDLLWRSAAGVVTMAIMNDAAVVKTAVIGGSAGDAVVGTGDVNGDGRSDVFWRLAGGVTEAWIMSGSTKSSTRTVWPNSQATLLRRPGRIA